MQPRLGVLTETFIEAHHRHLPNTVLSLHGEPFPFRDLPVESKLLLGEVVAGDRRSSRGEEWRLLAPGRSEAEHVAVLQVAQPVRRQRGVGGEDDARLAGPGFGDFLRGDRD